MLGRFRGLSMDQIRSEFRWSLPGRYNIGIDACDRHPDSALAMIHVNGKGRTDELRYGELREQSSRLANGLRALGVGPGDRVAVVLPQGPRVAVSHLAIFKLGAIAVPMTTLFGSDALLVRLRDSGARLVITDAKTSEKIEQHAAELPSLERNLLVESDWEPLLARSSRAFRPVDTAPEHPAVIIYTSGTTGGPKGALHGHQVLLGHLPGFELSHDFYGQVGDRFWTPADWAWIGGLFDALFPVLHHGSTILSYEDTGPFDPERAVSMMARFSIRNAFLPPTALKLMRQEGVQPPKALRLRSLMSGGEALGEEMLDWVRERFHVTVNEIYGQTECNYVVGNSQALFPVRPGSMGRAYVGHQVAVLDQGRELTDGLGEIAIRRPDPVMFLGYWGNGAATREKFAGDWLLTGDTATRDVDGYFRYHGRKDDVINSAGYRIGPTEIEDCLMSHPSVVLAAVIGVDDALRGQVVKAYIVLRAGCTPDDALKTDIQQLVRRRVAHYEYPRQIEFIDDMPLTTTGKIRRNELRERHKRTVAQQVKQ